MRIGVISDTHGFLDPRVADLFHGVEHILHAGDIGQPHVILELEQIAPVTAVQGNVDSGLDFRETEVVEFAGRKFLVHHIVDPHTPHDSIEIHIRRAAPDVVVFGHTHKPFCETIGGVLYFNPGYAGRQRFDLKRGVGLLHCDEKGLRHEFIEI